MKAGGLRRARSPASRGFTGRCLNNLRAAMLSVVFRICEQLLTEATRCNDVWTRPGRLPTPFVTSAAGLPQEPTHQTRKRSYALLV
jgi:hypothetical protein